MIEIASFLSNKEKPHFIQFQYCHAVNLKIKKADFAKCIILYVANYVYILKASNQNHHWTPPKGKRQYFLGAIKSPLFKFSALKYPVISCSKIIT